MTKKKEPELKGQLTDWYKSQEFDNITKQISSAQIAHSVMRRAVLEDRANLYLSALGALNACATIQERYLRGYAHARPPIGGEA